MKVLFSTNALPPKPGGIERATFGLASYLCEKQGAEVTIVCSKFPEINIPPAIFRVIEIPSFVIAGRLPIPNFELLRFLRQISDALKSTDILIIQSHLFPLNWLVALLGRRIDRIIWVTHSSGFIPDKNFLIRILLGFWERIGICILKKVASERIAVSEEGAHWLSRIGIQDAQVFPNAVELSQFSERRREILKSQEIVFILVGRLIIGKGGMDSIRILEKAISLLPPASLYRLKLRVIGSGPEEAQMREFPPVENLDVVFEGVLSHEEVLRSMQNADILLFPSSIPEGTPNVILEGAASGLLVLTTRVGGIGGLESINGCLIRSIEDMPDAIVDSIRNPKQARKTANNGRKFILNHHSWDTIYKDFLTETASFN